MPAVFIVFLFPIADDYPCVQQGVEAVDIQALIPQPTLEGLDIPVAPRGTGRDVVDACLFPSPVGDALTDQLRTVVTP